MAMKQPLLSPSGSPSTLSGRIKTVIGDSLLRHAIKCVVCIDVSIGAIFSQLYPPRVPTDIFSCSMMASQLVYLALAIFSLTLFEEHHRTAEDVLVVVVIPVGVTFVFTLLLMVVGYSGRWLLASWKRPAAFTVLIGSFAIFKMWKTHKKKVQDAADQVRLEESRKKVLEEQQAAYDQRLKEAQKEEEERLEKARQAREAAKQDALTKFDVAALDGKLEKASFGEALLPFVRQLIQQIPLEGPGMQMLNEQQLKLIHLLAEEAREDVAHVVDCDKVLDLIFGLVDSNQDGNIERSEVEAIIDELAKVSMEQSPDATAALAFRCADRNKNGKLGLGEVELLLEAVLQLTDFSVSIGIKQAKRVVNAPLFESEITKMIQQRMGDGSKREDFVKRVEGTPVDFIIGAGEAEKVGRGLVSVIGIVKAIHDATDPSQVSVLTSFYLSGCESLQGGIDEKTFVSSIAPTIKQRVTAKPDLSKAKASLEAALAAQSVDDCESLQRKIGMALEKHWVLLDHAVVAAQKGAADVVEELCRALFQLADIDGDGKISKKEISMLKELFDAIVTSAVMIALRTANVAGNPLPETILREFQALCPQACLSANAAESDEDFFIRLSTPMKKIPILGFDALDRNSDGTVSPDEFSALVIKISRVVLQLTQGTWSCYLGAASAFGLDALKVIWQDAGIDEVSMEEMPAVLSTMPIVLQAVSLCQTVKFG